MQHWRVSYLLIILFAGACTWEPGNPELYEVDHEMCEHLSAGEAERMYVQSLTSTERTTLPIEATPLALVFAADTSGEAVMRLEPAVPGVYGLLTTQPVSWTVSSEEDGTIEPVWVDVDGCDAVAQASWFKLHAEAYDVRVVDAPSVLHLLVVTLAESEEIIEDDGHGH